ncbi:MAG: tRNA uridine-5-carboxymethylaminomethyl(34) synthesis GTPase MnmE [Stappia sp.]|nr:tRNA uridine-5-carboxymethylaminomethyl(34) synthesis GTPase MnmE [Stappia sp.]
MSDTIYALSSGPVPAGVAVIRISGPATGFVLETIAGRCPAPRKAALCKLRAPGGGDLLDVALVLWFPAPASFTGEDVAELHCHGGRAVVAAVLETLSTFDGVRPAEAGEFTRRAFDNDRLDLLEVEGLADLIAAETEAQRRLAMSQAGGALGDLYDDWRARLTRARAMIEAAFDFADEDDVPDDVSEGMWAEVERLEGEIERHLDRSRGAERLREGLQVVLLGKPNAGKSSLLNALARRDVAIVAEEAGTTRDVIEVHLDLEGVPVTLVDTAGLRETEGVVEREGIRRALERAARADLALWLTAADDDQDAASAPPEAEAAREIWRVLSKVDLGSEGTENNERPSRHRVSVTTGEGLNALVADLARFARDGASGVGDLVASRERHRVHLAAALAAIDDARSEARPLELRAEDLRRASDSLGRIAGRTGVEDLLDVIFGEFCIGK